MIRVKILDLATKPSLAIFISLIFAFLYTLQSPLVAEDATVLFHRANYTDFRIPFYYAGYASVPAQILSYLVGDLPFEIQIFFYAAAACSIWSLMLWKASDFVERERSFVTVALVAYFSIFDPIYLYNLSYSLWPSLIICLLITAKYIEESKISRLDVALLIVLATASPLSVVCLLLLTLEFIRRVRTYKKGSRNIDTLMSKAFAQFLFFAAIFAAILLAIVDPNGSRSQIGPALQNLVEILSTLVKNPLAPFRVRDTDGGISIIGLFHLFSFIGCLLFAILHKSLRSGMKGSPRIFTLLIGVLLAFCISIVTGGVDSFPLAVRYMFPMVVALVIVADLAPQLQRKTKALVGIIFIGFLFSLMKTITGISSEWPTQKLLWAEIVSSNRYTQINEGFILRRPDHWNLAFGPFLFDEGQCKKFANSSSEVLFVIHCSSDRAILVTSQ